MTLLSLIVPVYNVEDYIEECLDSICHQLVEGVEVIVVNDGTRDNSIEIFKKHILRTQTSRFYRLINQENQGISAARNTGVKNSRGIYVAFLDSDDRLLDNYFFKILNIIRCESPDFIQFSANKFREGSEVGVIDFKHNDGLFDFGFELREQVFEKADWFVWLRVYKRKLFSGIDFPLDQNYEDAYTVPLVLMKCSNVYMLSDILISYRINGSGITLTRSTKNIDDAHLVAVHLMRNDVNSNALILAGLRMMRHCLMMSLYSEGILKAKKRWNLIKPYYKDKKVIVNNRGDFLVYYFGFYYLLIVFLIKQW